MTLAFLLTISNGHGSGTSDMITLEIIELRSSKSNLMFLADHINEIVEHIRNEGTDCEIHFYKSDMIDTDYAIHIKKAAGDNAADKSSIGIQIASELKEFGLINHTIWLEDLMKNAESKCKL